jgi:hypothetical protein
MGWVSYTEPITSPAIAPNIFTLKRNYTERSEIIEKVLSTTP